MAFQLSPHTGRLIGLFPEGSQVNFLWTNPDPVGPWLNVGGDRTWLAPEIELFIGDLRRPMETYAVPPSLDPGHWRSTGSSLSLVNETSLRLLRSNQSADVRLTKAYADTPNPIPTAPLEYAGYTQVTSLETRARLSIWNLLQLPPGGTMLIGTRALAQPRGVFGKLGDGELTTSANRVCWRMDRTGPDTKIAIQADLLTGRAAYLRPCASAGLADLVVREFSVDPGGEYVDAIWEPPHETGWAFQACCVRNGRESFNELEYHAPVGCHRDESRVWAFRGPVSSVQAAAEHLLGVDR